MKTFTEKDVALQFDSGGVEHPLRLRTVEGFGADVMHISKECLRLFGVAALRNNGV